MTVYGKYSAFSFHLILINKTTDHLNLYRSPVHSYSKVNVRSSLDFHLKIFNLFHIRVNATLHKIWCQIPNRNSIEKTAHRSDLKFLKVIILCVGTYLLTFIWETTRARSNLIWKNAGMNFIFMGSKEK